MADQSVLPGAQRRLFETAAEVKRYLLEQGIATPVRVRGDRSSGSQWFTVGTEPKFIEIISTHWHRGTVQDRRRLRRLQWLYWLCGPLGYLLSRVLRVFPVWVVRVRPWNDPPQEEFLPHLADADVRFLSSDCGVTARRLERIAQALRHTDALLDS